MLAFRSLSNEKRNWRAIKMRHEREFKLAETYVEPLPLWALSVFWFSAWLFCVLTWWGVIKVMVSC